MVIAPAANANDGDLPTDELQEVLLQLPSKPLCRLRTVCQAWESLLSDPLFLAAHASRCHADSLLVAAVRHATDHSRVDINLVDGSTGTVVKRLDGLSYFNRHLCAGGALLCLVGAKDGTVHVIDPVTGARTDLPGDTTAHGHFTSSYSFGQVPATGEYKVLHVYNDEGEQSCEVFTIGGRHSHEQQWRPAQSPPTRVESISRRRAVVHGVAYFLSSHPNGPHGAESGVHSIAAFDLETEEWRLVTLLLGRHAHISHLSLAELNGCLVTVHHNYRHNTMDLWFLTDLEKGTWSRTHSLCLDSVLRGRERTYKPMMDQLVVRDRECFAQPLMSLSDGRIALWVGGLKGVVVRVYDPRTDACKEVMEMGWRCSIVGLYTGSLLGFGCRKRQSVVG